MDEIIKKYKYIIIFDDTIYHMKNYQQILIFIQKNNPEIKLSTMLISRRFKEKNYFKIKNFIIKKLLW
tara:strand:+ start:934 stop:1137 length:204 start_codon:yes stop_codon:yes gene_type:complete